MEGSEDVVHEINSPLILDVRIYSQIMYLKRHWICLFKKLMMRGILEQ